MNIENVEINSFEDLNKICRACLCQDNDMITVQELAELYTQFTSIKVTLMPSTIKRK